MKIEDELPGAMGAYVSEVMFCSIDRSPSQVRHLNASVRPGEVVEGEPCLWSFMAEHVDHNHTDVHLKFYDFCSHLSMAPSGTRSKLWHWCSCALTRPRYERSDRSQANHVGQRSPHPEGTWPNTAHHVDTFKGFDADAGRQILGENAIQFYD